MSGGFYVPFGPSTQSDVNGGTNSLRFKPMVGLGTSIATEFYGQLFLPRFDYVHNGSLQGYSKNTMLLSFDFGHPFNDGLVFKYGFGVVRTAISGDGGTVDLGNGTQTQSFNYPAESSATFNNTLNLGLESVLSENFSFTTQFYLFSLLNSTARKVSYSFFLTAMVEGF